MPQTSPFVPGADVAGVAPEVGERLRDFGSTMARSRGLRQCCLTLTIRERAMRIKSETRPIAHVPLTIVTPFDFS